MKIRTITLLGMTLLGGTTAAQDRPRWFAKPRKDCPPATVMPWCAPESAVPPTSPTPSTPSQPAPAPSEPSLAQPPQSSFMEALASAGEAGTQPSASYSPGFFGDLLPSVILTPVFIPENGFVGLMASPNPSQAGGIKIAEGDSPRPTNRLYYNYNFFGNVDVNTPANVLTNVLPRMQVHRHIIGFEKTLLDGDASVGLRLPFFSMGGGSVAYETGFVGDLSVITKYAIINNQETGNVWSAGLILGTPTGGSPNPIANQGNQRPEQPRYRGVQIVPYTGYILNFCCQRLYLQGFHSIAVPTENEEPTFISNGFGLGYWLVREPHADFIQGFVPTVEVHVNTPLNNFSASLIGQTLMRNSVNLTSGAYIVLPRSIIGGAVGVPLSWGPHRIEALASWTLRF
ncbi:MAG: hypothetical protein N2039_05330 [Gemmataceae bacterium]|nr:hypothetical protein [Gemmataceae bacterium]